MLTPGLTPIVQISRASGSRSVPGALARPSLAVFSGTTVLAQNAGWATSADASALAAAALQVRAFASAATSLDAAFMLNLAPGVYTAPVSGVAGPTGVALGELYAVSE